MSEIAGETIIARAKQMIFARIDDEFLTVDSDEGACYSFNPTTMLVWNLIEKPTCLEAICRSLEAEFSVSAETCRHDVADVLTRLAQDGLVVINAPQQELSRAVP